MMVYQSVFTHLLEVTVKALQIAVPIANLGEENMSDADLQFYG